MQKVRKRSRIIMAIMCMILLLFLQVPSWAATDEMVIVQNDPEQYIIYHPKIENQNFEFAFSTKQDATNEELDFMSAVQSEGKYVAYIDQEMLDQLVTGEDDSIFFYAKENNNYLVQGEKVELANAIPEEHLQVIENITKKIDVDTTQQNTDTQIIDGAEYTVTTGKVVITDRSDATYSYQLVKVADSEDYSKLMDLAETISNFPADISMTEKITTLEEFYTIYAKLAPTATSDAWLPVEDREIAQPSDTKDGEQYILWIKMEAGDLEAPVIDAQFLTSVEDMDRKTETEQVVKKTTSLLPITYDSLVLIGVFGVIAVALVIVIIAKKKSEKENGKHTK